MMVKMITIVSRWVPNEKLVMADMLAFLVLYSINISNRLKIPWWLHETIWRIGVMA